MYLPSGYPRCRWVCLFIRTDLEKFSITSLAHQLILFSEWVSKHTPLFELSFWRHLFTALVSKWCNAKFLQISSDEETNSSISWIALGWVHKNFFWWIIPLIKDRCTLYVTEHEEPRTNQCACCRLVGHVGHLPGLLASVDNYVTFQRDGKTEPGRSWPKGREVLLELSMKWWAAI